jgi:hypothetical protein
MSYHGWDPAAVGYANGGARTLRIDRVTVRDGLPVLLGPTNTPATF